MAHALYMDTCVRFAITRGLRARGVDVLTAQEDGNTETPDPLVLDRAGELGRVMYSEDEDFLREGVRRQRAGIPFAGVIYAHQKRVPIGTCIRSLRAIVETRPAEEVVNNVIYISRSQSNR